MQFYQTSFTGKTAKEAYLRSCKWVAKYVISKEVEIGGETFWKTEKILDADSPTVKLELYAMLDLEDSTKNFCTKCQEFHNLFYMNQQFNCNKCNYTAFKKQMYEKMTIKKNWRKEKLNYILEN
mgnify:CR=1 FL=1